MFKKGHHGSRGTSRSTTSVVFYLKYQVLHIKTIAIRDLALMVPVPGLLLAIWDISLNRIAYCLKWSSYSFNFSHFRALTNRTIWAWGQLGFDENILLSNTYIHAKVKKFWEDTTLITSPKKGKKRQIASMEEKLDTVFYVLSCR